MRVAIGFGSNVGDRAAHLAFGRARLGEAIRWTAISPIFETTPVGPVADQPPFLNQVGVGETDSSPHALLDLCLAIERERGRERTVRWGPRTLDLDVLLCGDRIIGEPPVLIVPHPELARRAFVLVPLAEIAPGWVVPGIGKTVAVLRDAIEIDGREGVTVWRSSATKPPT